MLDAFQHGSSEDAFWQRVHSGASMSDEELQKGYEQTARRSVVEEGLDRTRAEEEAIAAFVADIEKKLAEAAAGKSGSGSLSHGPQMVEYDHGADPHSYDKDAAKKSAANDLLMQKLKNTKPSTKKHVEM